MTEYRKSVTPEGWITVDPKPSADALAAFYRDLYYQDAAQRSKSYQDSYDEEEIPHKRLMAELRLHAIAACRDGAGQDGAPRLLDVGCGEGFFLSAAADRGWEVTGIDFNRYAVETFNPHLAQRVRTGNAHELLANLHAAEERFDACVLNNVLEHVLDPSALLADLRTIIAAGGVTAITVPNDYSALQLLALDRGDIEHEFWFTPPQHLHYFNVETCRQFMEFHDLEILDVFCSFPIDFFLLHPGSNYVRDRRQGKAAHRAQIALDLLMARQGMDNFHKLAQAMAACGVGRTITIVVR